MAHLGVYIGLKETAEQLGLPKTNFWIYPGNDFDAAVDGFMDDPQAPFPVVYISFPSAKDPDYARRHPGTATIEIVAPAPFEWFSQWQGTTWGKRGDDYDAFKAQLGERLMQHLYDKLPQLQGKVDYYEVSTPLSTDHFCAYQYGELYGLDHDPVRLQQTWLGPRTRFKGLWLTGQDVLTCGVTGAMMAGLLTTSAIIGMRQLGIAVKTYIQLKPNGLCLRWVFLTPAGNHRNPLFVIVQTGDQGQGFAAGLSEYVPHPAVRFLRGFPGNR